MAKLPTVLAFGFLALFSAALSAQSAGQGAYKPSIVYLDNDEKAVYYLTIDGSPFSAFPDKMAKAFEEDKIKLNAAEKSIDLLNKMIADDKLVIDAGAETIQKLVAYQKELEDLVAKYKELAALYEKLKSSKWTVDFGLGYGWGSASIPLAASIGTSYNGFRLWGNYSPGGLSAMAGIALPLSSK
jgi:hypothetical protein